MPDYWELFSPKHGNAGSTNTFNGVNPEKTLQLDLGFQQQHGALNTWASAYAGLVDDYILMSYHHHPSMGMDGHDMSHDITAGAKMSMQPLLVQKRVLGTNSLTVFRQI